MFQQGQLRDVTIVVAEMDETATYVRTRVYRYDMIGDPDEFALAVEELKAKDGKVFIVEGGKMKNM